MMKKILAVAFVALQQFGFFGLLSGSTGLELMAQEITVEDCKILPTDLSAEQNAVKDNNGNLCGLVKISANGITDLQFPNTNEYMGKVEYVASENCYYVHVPEMLSKISFTHEKYLPGMINLKDFGYKVKSGKTYLVTLTASTTSAREGRIITFRLSPATSGEITYGGNSMSIPSNGIVEIEHDAEQFSYVVTAPYFKPFKGNISTGTASEARSIAMQPITIKVDVKCNEGGAHVFVDDVDYGKVGTLNIPLGKHNIRVARKGFLDSSRDEQIMEDTHELSFEISKNRGKQIDIHATPVTIISDSKHIYKNNKRLEEWEKSGDVVYMMPNRRYLLTTQSNKRNFVDVGTTPMTLRFVKGKIVE